MRRSSLRLLPSPILVLSVAIFSGTARADILELKNGKLLKGTYAGGSANTIRFETSEGIQVISRSEALALTFTGPRARATPPPAPATPPAPKPQTASQPSAVTVPSGSLLLVRMETQVSSNDKPGRRFTAKLEADLRAGQRVVAKAGSKVYGRVEKSQRAGRLAGRSGLALSLTEINIDGKLRPIRTSNFAEVGQSSFRKTARNAALGAAIGAAVDGGKGAATGAAIGGAPAILRRGKSVTVPVNALLEFRLTQSLKLNVAR